MSPYERLVNSQNFFSPYLTQEDLSRLGRDYIMTGHYMEQYFPEHRVRYISLLDGIDNGVDSTANDITPFRAIMNDVQGRMVKISYKSKKCLRQSPENWVVVEGTHEPIIDPETFQKVQMLVNSRKHTRSRTYDFLLKGLIFCHECGYPMAVINRKNAAGEDRLFFVYRTYQRFTKAGVCTCHSIKEETVNEDFQRIYQKVKMDRTVLEDRLKNLHEQME